MCSFPLISVTFQKKKATVTESGDESQKVVRFVRSGKIQQLLLPLPRAPLTIFLSIVLLSHFPLRSIWFDPPSPNLCVGQRHEGPEHGNRGGGGSGGRSGKMLETCFSFSKEITTEHSISKKLAMECREYGLQQSCRSTGTGHIQ